MVINGNKVTGLFRYDSEATYTQCDLVYKDSTLYVAETEVTGIDPSDSVMSSGKYHIYLGDRMVDLDEYLNYELTEESKQDKYIPASLLPAILNHYLTGVTEKGVIESTGVSADDIIVNDNINHAIYSVSRNLNGLPVDIYSAGSSRLNGEKLILKQYTYTEKVFENSVQVTKRVRVQELIDHSQYMVWYRYLKLDDHGSISQWKSITLNTSNVHDGLIRLANEYRSRINALQSMISNLAKNFRFKSLDLPKRKSNVFKIPEDYLGKYRMTASVQIKTGNGIYTVVNFVINLSSSITKYESDGVYLLINNDKLELYEDKEFTQLHRKAVFNDIYIHEFYE